MLLETTFDVIMNKINRETLSSKVMSTNDTKTVVYTKVIQGGRRRFVM